MLTKLKYVGVDKADLLDIYILYIRSVLEYCSTVWHSTLTAEQSQQIEKVQKTSGKIILGDEYSGYENSLRAVGLDSLKTRRENKCLSFGIKCLLHPVHSSMFPLNPQLEKSMNTRHKEHFQANKTQSESLPSSAQLKLQRN